MTNKDKVLAAFLVSVGMFSATVAVKYVSALSDSQKNALMPAAKNTGNIILLANTSSVPALGGNNNKA